MLARLLTIYNLPPWMGLKESYVELSMLILGKKNPGQNIDVFLRPLVEELITLYNDRIETYDAARKENFIMKVVLLWTIIDFPAYAMLLGWSTHGKLACPYYMVGSKFVTIQPFTMAIRIEKTNQKLPGFRTHNWVKRSIFWELPYWHTLLIRHNLDVMHIEKNVFENLFNTIMGTAKTKDNVKARKDVKKYCNRAELHIHQVGTKDMKPKASYTLTKPQVDKIYEWLAHLKFPDGRLGSMKRKIRNQAKVKGSMVESYRIEELSTFYSQYFKPIIETQLTRDFQNFAPDIPYFTRTDSQLSIFKVPCQILYEKSGRRRSLSDEEMHMAHNYIILSCEELHPFIGLFDDFVRHTQPQLDEKGLESYRDKKFAEWLEQHATSQVEQVYYAPYPSLTKDLKDWWVVMKTKSMSMYELEECKDEEDGGELELVNNNGDETQTELSDEAEQSDEAEFLDNSDESDDDSDDISDDSSDNE
nr:hypothetical protein [Tanacetum cinerariifolium]